MAENVLDFSGMTIKAAQFAGVQTVDDGAITSAKIADGAIMNADINASAGIVTTKIAAFATDVKAAVAAKTEVAALAHYTDSTTGTPSTTLASISDAATKNAIASLNAHINAIIDALKA